MDIEISGKIDKAIKNAFNPFDAMQTTQAATP